MVVRAARGGRGINGGTQANRGQFIFRANWHEPDPIAMMGKIYPARVQRQANWSAAMSRGIRRPRHLAFKLVQHFMADEPTPEMVEPIRKAFLNSGGNLKTVALALINLPEAWSTPLEQDPHAL